MFLCSKWSLLRDLQHAELKRKCDSTFKIFNADSNSQLGNILIGLCLLNNSGRFPCEVKN